MGNKPELVYEEEVETSGSDSGEEYTESENDIIKEECDKHGDVWKASKLELLPEEPGTSQDEIAASRYDPLDDNFARLEKSIHTLIDDVKSMNQHFGEEKPPALPRRTNIGDQYLFAGDESTKYSGFYISSSEDEDEDTEESIATIAYAEKLKRLDRLFEATVESLFHRFNEKTIYGKLIVLDDTKYKHVKDQLLYLLRVVRNEGYRLHWMRRTFVKKELDPATPAKEITYCHAELFFIKKAISNLQKFYDDVLVELAYVDEHLARD